MSARLDMAQILEWTGGELATGPRNLVFAGVSTDTRALAPGSLFIALAGEKTDGHRFCREAMERGAAGVLVRRDFDPAQVPGAAVVRVADTTRALGDLARGLRNSRPDLRVAGITGSAGKTTTKDLAAQVARAGLGEAVLATEGNFNNHLGVPHTLLRLEPQHTHAVIEMGMNHAGELRYLAGIARPQEAVITNVHPVHLEFLGTVENVARAKGEILEGLGPEDTAILNADDPRVMGLAAGRPFRVLTFGMEQPADVRAREVRARGARGAAIRAEILGASVEIETRLLGRHNAYNVLAALAVGVAWDVPTEAMARAIAAFAPAAKRSRIVALPSGARAIDDVYNANPRSMELALALLADLGRDGRRLAALGDMFELGEHADPAHRRLGEAAAGAGLSFLVAVGAHAGLVCESAVRAGMPREACLAATSHEEAAAALSERLRAGDWLLVKGSRGMAMERVLELLQGEPGCSTGH